MKDVGVIILLGYGAAEWSSALVSPTIETDAK
jgi:hypothetical protein